VPVADPALPRDRIVPLGAVASPFAIPARCRFHPRYPFVMPRCREEPAAAREVGAGHLAACHLLE